MYFSNSPKIAKGENYHNCGFQSTCLYKDAKIFHVFSIMNDIRVVFLKTQKTLTAPEQQWLSTPNYSSLNPSHLINFD